MIMTWRDREGWLNFVCCNDSRVVDQKERDGGWRWELWGGYKPIWEIRGTTWLIGLGRPRIGVITCRIGTRTCCIRDGKFTCTQNSLQSQFLIMISPISAYLSLSRPQLYHHLRIRSVVITLYLSMPRSRVNMEYSVHCILHHPKIDCLPHPASLLFLGRPCCSQFSTFPQSRVNQWIESPLPSRLSPELPPLDWMPLSTLISLNHGLQVHPQPRTFTDSKYTVSSVEVCMSHVTQGMDSKQKEKFVSCHRGIVREICGTLK